MVVAAKVVVVTAKGGPVVVVVSEPDDGVQAATAVNTARASNWGCFTSRHYPQSETEERCYEALAAWLQTPALKGIRFCGVSARPGVGRLGGFRGG